MNFLYNCFCIPFFPTPVSGENNKSWGKQRVENSKSIPGSTCGNFFYFFFFTHMISKQPHMVRSNLNWMEKYVIKSIFARLLTIYFIYLRKRVGAGRQEKRLHSATRLEHTASTACPIAPVKIPSYMHHWYDLVEYFLCSWKLLWCCSGWPRDGVFFPPFL